MKKAETGLARQHAGRFRRGHAGSKILAQALLCAALLLMPAPGRADFGTIRRVVNGTGLPKRGRENGSTSP